MRRTVSIYRRVDLSLCERFPVAKRIFEMEGMAYVLKEGLQDQLGSQLANHEIHTGTKQIPAPYGRVEATP